MLGHLSMASTDFNPAGVLTTRARAANGVSRNANGPRNLFAACQVRKKVLSEPLSRHAEILSAPRNNLAAGKSQPVARRSFV
jgi:hypothetical protein